MSKKYITTINGEELPISKAKKFTNGYYKIGDVNVENSGDCYKINDKFYRYETGQVIFNYSEKKYQLYSNAIILGLVENNNLRYFNRNEENKIPVTLEDGTKTFAINEEVLKKNKNYRERLITGDYLHISLLKATDFNKILPPQSNYKTSLPYDSKGITDKHLDMYNHLYDSKINYEVESVGNFIEPLTFGLEFETIAGFVPERVTKRLGLIPLRDGSISGLEYVTVPLSGKKGVQTVIDICEELEYRTIYDNSCSLHLHIGNIPRTPEFILAFLKTSSWLQDDIFSLFPLYKKYNMGIKNKNYSKPYNIFEIFNELDPIIDKSNINKNFDVLFKFLTSNSKKFADYGEDLRNVESHPFDTNSNQKWNIKTRYFLHNFIPLIFGNKQTIEFRIHTPTFDSYKILMFLILNTILIKFTQKHQDDILKDPCFFKKINIAYGDKSTLTNLIKFFISNEFNISNTLSKIFSYLIDYVRFRKHKVEELTRNGNIIFDEKSIQIFEKIDFNFNKKISLNNNENNIKLDEEILIKRPQFNTIDPKFLDDFHFYSSFGKTHNDFGISSISKTQTSSKKTLNRPLSRKEQKKPMAINDPFINPMISLNTTNFIENNVIKIGEGQDLLHYNHQELLSNFIADEYLSLE
jgi:hypothetical protein